METSTSLTVNTYIAFFRGINVGGKNILPMVDLVRILETLKLANVKTYIQSGNVTFTGKKKSKGLAGEISLAVEKDKGFSPHVLILEGHELGAAIDNNPYDTSDGKILHFFFLDAVPQAPDLDGLAAVKSKTERFELMRDVFYLYAPDGIGKSKLAAKVEKAMGVPATARNWNTVSKVFSMTGLACGA